MNTMLPSERLRKGGNMSEIFCIYLIIITGLQSSMIGASHQTIRIEQFKHSGTSCIINSIRRSSKTNYIYRDQIYSLCRGGDTTPDPNEVEENKNVEHKKKGFHSSSGWSFLSAFRMKEEALDELANELDMSLTTASTPSNPSFLNASTNANADANADADADGTTEEFEPSEHIKYDADRSTSTRPKAILVGGAGAIATTKQPSSSSIPTTSNSAKNTFYQRVLWKSPTNTTSEDRDESTTLSPNSVITARQNVATAASRLINEYVDTDLTESTDYLDLNSVNDDDDEYEEYDGYDYEDENIRADIESELEVLSKTEHSKSNGTETKPNMETPRNSKPKHDLNRKQILEHLVDESEMQAIREKVETRIHKIFSSPTTSKSAPTPTHSIQETKTNDIASPKLVLKSNEKESVYISSGYWNSIDRIASLGFSTKHTSLRLSRQLRTVRKVTARVTGLHGLLSGKHKSIHLDNEKSVKQGDTLLKKSVGEEKEALTEEVLGMIRRKIAAIDRAKERLGSRIASDEGFIKGTIRIRRNRKESSIDDDIEEVDMNENKPWRSALRFGREIRDNRTNHISTRTNMDHKDSKHYQKEEILAMTETEATILEHEQEIQRQLRAIEIAEAKQRKDRVHEIDRLIIERQESIVELQCEKDFLQRRPNPLFNYTSEDGENVTSSRIFNFPPPDIVSDYIEELKDSGRLIMLNHTSLWRNDNDDNEEDETIGDDLFTPSADVQKLYRNTNNHRRRNGNSHHGGTGGGGGSWLLRQTLGKGITLGEKLGETVEVAAYQAVCKSVMSILARSISAMHGVNVMTYSDIRLYLGQAPDLPPVGNSLKGSNYAQETIKEAIQRGSKSRSKSKHSKRSQYSTDPTFIQRDAVVETLISHCQISAPLLKLFPLTWQRAMLGNIITLITSITSDFCAGMKFQILGHQLSLSFEPITEKDIIRHIESRTRFNHRRAKPEEFEAAVRATAQDLSNQMKFLDRWHHRALGSGLLRAQVGNLIARIVLTLVDDVLCGATIDLWSAQAGGPRVIAGLEYRLNNGL